jgi:NADH dehydrogenase FAD-containing subunit
MAPEEPMQQTVVVIGGGYGGIVAAKALDDVAHVVLVEPRDAFVHNVAALRALVDPDWIDRIFLPYEGLLDHGRVVRDRAVRVDGTLVELGSGDRIAADFVVLATGSRYPFPAKTDLTDSDAAKARIRSAHEALAGAGDVLLLGAGPTGLELAGEIKAAWADKRVTIVDPVDDILSAELVPELRAELRRQLDELGVGLVLGTSLREDPPSEPGEAKAFTAVTRSGREIPADLWFRCYGVDPVSDYLAGDPARARQRNGHVGVTAELRLPGQERIFAIGDLTAIAEGKKASAAGHHAEVVAHNIRALILGGPDLRSYEPAPPSLALPLGPRGGASYSPDMGLLGAETTSQIKGADLMVDTYAALLGLDGGTSP